MLGAAPRNRRAWSVVLSIVAMLVVSRGAAAAPFGFDDVAARAHKLAEKQYEAPKVQVPEWLGKITYDQWRDIRFRPDQALWHEKALPFRAQFGLRLIHDALHGIMR